MFLFLALLSLAEGAANSRKFSINVQYTCTNITADGSCAAWSSGGSMEQETSCFPGDSVVLSNRGLKRMDALEIGDVILGHDTSTGKDIWTPVRSWLHRFPTIDYSYIKLHTSKGEIEVARFHNIAVAEGGTVKDYFYADEIEIGSHLWTREGPLEVLSKTQNAENKGVFAPLTVSSNFYVGTNTSSTLFLSHSFAHVRYPNSMSPILHGLMSACELFDKELHDLDDKEQYVHPVARKLQAFFPFLLDKAPTKFQVQATTSKNNNSKKKRDIITFISSIMTANPLLFCSSAGCGSSTPLASGNSVM